MKKILFYLFITSPVMLQSCRPQQADKQQVAELKSALAKKEYFRLNTLFTSRQTALNNTDRLFYKALLLNYYNKCDSSNLVINDVLKNYTDGLTDTAKRTLYEAQAYNYIRQYKYKQAVTCYDTLIEKFKKITDSTQLADYKNSKLLWGSVITVKPQTASIPSKSVLKWTDDKVGLITIPVSAGKDTSQFVFDTGANISVITQSIAKKWHIKVFNVSFDLGGGTGFTTKSATGVADSIYIGDVLVKNAVFLILPDDMLYVKQINYRQNGIIGLPIISQLGQWQFKQDGTANINTNAVKAGLSNMVIDGLMPHVNFGVLNTYLPFRFDSGANSTTLYSLFFEQFKPYILKHAQSKQLREGGVGGVVTSKAYLLKNLAFSIANKNVMLPIVNVRTAPYNKDDKVTAYGNLGRDIIKENHNNFTINFNQMFVRMD